MVRGIPDIDNISPLIYRILDLGHTVTVFLDSEARTLFDHPIVVYLASLEGVVLCDYINRSSDVNDLKVFLERSDLLLCDWGPGIPLTVTQKMKNLLLNRGYSFRQKCLRVAMDRGIRLIAFPHGYNTREDVKTKNNNKGRALLNTLNFSRVIEDYSDRGVFDLFVFNNDAYRVICEKYYNMSRVTTKVIGPFKYAKWWLDILRENVYPDVKTGSTSCLEVVIFLPKWANNVDSLKVDELMMKLSLLNGFNFIFKEHPRPGVSVLTDKMRSLVNRVEGFTVSSQDSRVLLEMVDVVIDFGSSISLDALVQSTPVIYPEYVQTNTSILSRFEGIGVYQLNENDDPSLVLTRAITSGVNVEYISKSIGVVELEVDINRSVDAILF